MKFIAVYSSRSGVWVVGAVATEGEIYFFDKGCPVENVLFLRGD